MICYPAERPVSLALRHVMWQQAQTTSVSLVHCKASNADRGSAVLQKMTQRLVMLPLLRHRVHQVHLNLKPYRQKPCPKIMRQLLLQLLKVLLSSLSNPSSSHWPNPSALSRNISLLMHNRSSSSLVHLPARLLRKLRQRILQSKGQRVLPPRRSPVPPQQVHGAVPGASET